MRKTFFIDGNEYIVETTTTMNCRLCDEPVTDDDHPVVMGIIAHPECMVREVLGGIGHHLDHKHWCLKMHDPDAGRTYRQSALEVADLVRERGVQWLLDD